MKTASHMGEKLQQEAENKGLKPAQIAAIFDVKPPSVYDWYAFGRIHKKHYPKLVEWSGKSIGWWLDFPQPSASPMVQSANANYVEDDPRHKVLLELFDSLPASEQTALIQTLTQKKQHYDLLIEELLQRRNTA